MEELIMSEFIWDSYTTLNKCRETIENRISGAYMRFGDGDVLLREGYNDMLQYGNVNLANEMKEAFSLSGEGIIKCLPLHSDKYGYMPNMSLGVHKWDDEFADRMFYWSRQYFKNDKIYSMAALHYLAIYDREFTIDFLRFIRGLNPIFIGNENVPTDIAKKLFNAKTHVKTPPQQCFDHLDRIESEAFTELDKYINDYNVVVLAMGTSGRLLMKRILKKQKYNGFLFDFGSLLDAICGWNTRDWIALSPVPATYWDEMLNEIAKE